MTERPLTFAFARLTNAAYFVLTSAYCLFVFNPFTHSQFIQHEYLSWLSAFVAHHAALYWVTLLLTALTFVPECRESIDSRHPRVYLAVMAAVGVYLAVHPVLPTVGETNGTLALALAALAPPMWLSVIDHRATPLRMALPDDRRVLEASIVSAAVVWLVFALGAPIRLGRVVAADMPAGWFVPALVVSAVVHLLVFLASFAVVYVALRAARALPSPGPAAYWLLVALGAAAVTSVLVGMVFAAIAFTGGVAWIFGAMMGSSVALAWAGAARHASATRGDNDPLELLLTPMTMTKAGSGVSAGILLGLMPFVAFALVAGVAQFDWNFLVQKLAVLAVWFVCFGLVYGWLAGRRAFRPTGVKMTPLVVVAFVSAAVVAAPRASTSTPAPATLELALDRYAAVDPSFRLIRDARAANAGHTSAFYAFLSANTLVSPRRVQPADIDFARLDRPPAGPRPNIFLIVVDSLRPDYVSPYNPRVTFTPAIERFAAESTVFTRTFARYGGTNLSVPAIWAGGMLIHQLEQGPFDGRDALLKLVDADGYRALLSMDSVVRTLVPARPNVTPLDVNLSAVDFEMCRTTEEIERSLDGNLADRRPVFAYALPQNIHIAVAVHTKVPEGESYPGFFAPVAHGVRTVDRCFGSFVDYLKKTGRYDDSVVILTSDHGDSLGEDGRYGHSLFMFPEVVRVPLIVHLPTALRDRVKSDPHQVSFSTDLTPTLYALLGHPPADLGPLFGSPLFVPAGSTVPSRARQSYLLASSYGAVYALLSDNGRRLYIADAVDGRDYAFSLRDHEPDVRLELTPAMIEENRRLIREQLTALAALNRYQAEP